MTNQTMHTPNDIEVMLHYYCSSARHPRYNAPAVMDAINNLVRQGLLMGSQRESGHEATPRGEAWVRVICSTPFPEQAWVNPVTKEVIK